MAERGETSAKSVPSVDSAASPAEAPPARRAKTPAAQRALDEAQARRVAAKGADAPREVNGREGPDPVRYGDWENKGIASDF